MPGFISRAMAAHIKPPARNNVFTVMENHHQRILVRLAEIVFADREGTVAQHDFLAVVQQECLQVFKNAGMRFEDGPHFDEDADRQDAAT